MNFEVFRRRGYFGFDKLDSGGQANVYKTSKGGVYYAIKVIQLSKERNADGSCKVQNDLKRELSIVANIHHPNIIRVHEILRTTSKAFIIMDYASNGSIASLVRTSGPLCEQNAKMWWTPIARAVKYLHGKEIAHRDLKLDNVLLDGQLNPIMIDFGFSCLVSRHASTGAVQMSDTYCGTTSHQPPEMIKETPYDPFKADVWSLAVMLFIMINQKYPFDKHDQKLMHYNQMNRNYKLEPDIENKMSPLVKELISLMLDPEPRSRPSINKVCNHGWFPIMFRAQDHQFAKSAKEKTKSKPWSAGKPHKTTDQTGKKSLSLETKTTQSTTQSTGNKSFKSKSKSKKAITTIQKAQAAAKGSDKSKSHSEGLKNFTSAKSKKPQQQAKGKEKSDDTNKTTNETDDKTKGS